MSFENIIDTNKHIKIIDPKGVNVLPIEYDLGKCLQCLEGKYDFIKNDLFNLNIEDQNVRFHIKSEKLDYVKETFESEILSEFGFNVLKASKLFSICHIASLIAHHQFNSRRAKAFFFSVLLLMKRYENRYL